MWQWKTDLKGPNVWCRVPWNRECCVLHSCNPMFRGTSLGAMTGKPFYQEPHHSLIACMPKCRSSTWVSMHSDQSKMISKKNQWTNAIRESDWLSRATNFAIETVKDSCNVRYQCTSLEKWSLRACHRTWKLADPSGNADKATVNMQREKFFPIAEFVMSVVSTEKFGLLITEALDYERKKFSVWSRQLSTCEQLQGFKWLILNHVFNLSWDTAYCVKPFSWIVHS